MELPKRKPTRLQNYDYSTGGAYFITLCTHNKQKILCNIVNISGSTTPKVNSNAKILSNSVGEGALDVPKIVLSPIGEIAQQELLKIESHYDNVKIDKYIIMPNHIHLIVTLTERINPSPTIKYDISNVIGKFKAAVTRNVGNAFMHSEKLWQRSFHDHIIRNENDYKEIWQYIDTNPQKWNTDCFFCE